MRRLVLLLPLFLLTACSDDAGDGTGGTSRDSGSISTDEPNPDTCGDAENWAAADEALEDGVLEIVNVEREAGTDCPGKDFESAGDVVMDEALRCAARLHSKDMVEQGYFSHESADGRSFTDRAGEAGTSSNAENIAAGQRTAEAVMSSWMDSDGHCRNIMGPGKTRIGIGHYEGHWTMMLGN